MKTSDTPQDACPQPAPGSLGEAPFVGAYTLEDVVLARFLCSVIMDFRESDWLKTTRRACGPRAIGGCELYPSPDDPSRVLRRHYSKCRLPEGTALLTMGDMQAALVSSTSRASLVIGYAVRKTALLMASTNRAQRRAVAHKCEWRSPGSDKPWHLTTGDLVDDTGPPGHLASVSPISSNAPPACAAAPLHWAPVTLAA